MEYGRVLSDTYPRDNEGEVTRVHKELQTKLWGTRKFKPELIYKGGMEWTGSKYEHCWLRHFFYAPVYADNGTYTVYVTASKKDIKEGSDKIYTIEMPLTMIIGDDFGDNITDEIYDRINDN